MIPDKIYISPNIENRTWLIGKGDTINIEYICKDTLIARLAERMENAKAEAGGCSNVHASGKYIAYQEMVDLIKEL